MKCPECDYFNYYIFCGYSEPVCEINKEMDKKHCPFFAPKGYNKQLAEYARNEHIKEVLNIKEVKNE